MLPAFGLFGSHLLAQDTSGFWWERANAPNGRVEWHDSWFNGEAYNFSFTDNLGFSYRLFRYGPPIRPPTEFSGQISAFNAAMGDFHTTPYGPTFLLLGYVEEDSLWCFLPAVLSPEYVQRVEWAGGARYAVNEIWCSWEEVWDNPPETPPIYQFSETSANHSLNIWGRLPTHKTVHVWWGADNFGRWSSYRHDETVDKRIYGIRFSVQ
jgi:hypothetical protein